MFPVEPLEIFRTRARVRDMLKFLAACERKLKRPPARGYDTRRLEAVVMDLCKDGGEPVGDDYFTFDKHEREILYTALVVYVAVLDKRKVAK